MISDRFKRLKAPGSGRTVVQLTSGGGFCYPLYYYIPSMTKDSRYLIHHRAEGGQVQLHRLDLHTAESVRLTNANASETQWYPWDMEAGSGVLDHRSVLNRENNEVIYFNGREVWAVNVSTLSHRHLFTLPEGRAAIGQNDVTPDGNWFVYIHADEELHKSIYFKDGRVIKPERWKSRGTELCAYHLVTGEHRTLVVINSPIHHVIAFDLEHVVFCHPATENGMLWTDLLGGWYTHLRTQDPFGAVCHYLTTSRGIAYEVQREKYIGSMAGLYDPYTHKKFEFPLPSYFGYTHTASDEEGRLWIFESNSEGVHDIHALIEHREDGNDEWLPLISHWQTYGTGQKSHFHPRLTPDRQWLIITAGDPSSETNHIYLLDVADLKDTRGIL